MKKSTIFILVIIFLSAASLSYAQYRFFGGEEWLDIDSSSKSDSVDSQIKILVLQSIQEASIFIGNPILSNNETDVAQYIDFIDEFYKQERNRNIPLYFALKIADMNKQGLPEGQIRFYQMAITKKLEDSGLAQ